MEDHLAEMEVLQNSIPANIVIGPFYVNTENVRKALTKKRKELGNAVLDLLARQLRIQADEVRSWSQIEMRMCIK